MANSYQVNVYRINNNDIPATPFGVPSTGNLYRSLSNQTVGGVRCYSVIQMPNGVQLFVVETVAALITLGT